MSMPILPMPFFAYAYAYFAYSYDNIFMKMLTKKKQTVMMKPARGAQK